MAIYGWEGGGGKTIKSMTIFIILSPSLLAPVEVVVAVQTRPPPLPSTHKYNWSHNVQNSFLPSNSLIISHLPSQPPLPLFTTCLTE